MEKADIRIFGEHLIDDNSIDQLKRCLSPGDIGVLTADAHYGYGHPIGGVVAYRDKISLSGVGFDIACGNKAVRTGLRTEDVNITRVTDEITKVIGFGVGRPNPTPIDHPVFRRVDRLPVKVPASFKKMLSQKARAQLGTVGSGNHFVDLFTDEEGFLWIGVHFGSRGLGHTITMGFIALSQGKAFNERVNEGSMDSPPVLFDAGSELATDYLECLDIAGEYAYSGRDYVVDRVMEILSTTSTYEVHNHHNFLWKEQHEGRHYWVVRKGCTPAFPGQEGFIGSTMFDTSVIVRGRDTFTAQRTLYSTVHGAGRVMSRRAAAGKTKWVKDSHGRKQLRVVKPGLVDYRQTLQKARDLGIELRGGGADESPECYKPLSEVLQAMGDSIEVLHTLKPVGVVMAGADVFDPYKD